MRIALVHMPWGALERPALGVSLLKAAAQGQGVSCELRYCNMRFAERIGAEPYRRITHDLPHVAFAGEWVFTEALFGSDARRDAGYVDEVLRGEWQLSEPQIGELFAARAQVEAYLDELLEDPSWQDFDLVGFTSTFEQNIASLALARRIRLRWPHVPIAFGGANWEGPMGQELHRAFDCVDFAFSGEADIGFPRLLQALQLPQPARLQQLQAIPGLVWRRDGATVSNGPAEPVEAMDSLPTPDLSDYFDARARSAAASQVSPVLLFETSRGCWWGAKSHCTFCGLNGHSMGYRSKSPARVLAELGEMIRRWPCPTLEAVDNILDMKYFDSVLPALEQMDLPGPVFYEVKANMKRHHVAALRRARITRIQPGIESLSDHVLQLMAKGTTALRNVQLLKWCREYDVAVDWNLLYGFPGETDADYQQIEDVLRRIGHLQLPGACGPIRLDRFSPYFERPAAYGLFNVRPLPVYRWIYPVPGLDHARVAYYFRFDHQADRAPSPRALQAAALAESMRAAPNPGSLQALPHRDGGLHLADTRRGARTSALRLSPFERCIVMAIDETASLDQVVRALQRAWPEHRFDPAQVRGFLDELVALDLALSDGRGHWLGLALMPASLRDDLERRSRRSEPRPVALPIQAQAVAPSGRDRVGAAHA